MEAAQASEAPIERPGFIGAVEKHERVGAIRIEPYLIRRKRNGLIDDFQSPRKIARQDEPVGQPANVADGNLFVLLPAGIVRNGVGCGTLYANGIRFCSLR